MTLYESILFVKKLTFYKIINFIGRKIDILVSQTTGKFCSKFMPWSFSIEPCNICNLKCKACPSGLGMLTRKKQKITLENFFTAVDNIKPFATNLFIYFQGEPFMNENFCKMASYASKCGIFTVTSTNGHFINMDVAQQTILSKLDKIIVSLDGYDQESYQIYRVGGNFDKATQAIENLATAKKNLNSKTPIIEVQVLATKYNLKKKKEIEKLAKHLGANQTSFKSMQIENQDDYQTFIDPKSRYSRYKKVGNQLVLKNKVGFCKRIFSSVVIDAQLNVLPCCYDKDSIFKLGNIKTLPLKKIVVDKKAEDFFLMMQTNQRPPMCNNCGG